MLPREAMFRVVGIGMTTLALAACGGGGGGGSSPDSTPVLSNLRYAPNSALQFDSAGRTAISGTFDFRDPDGDLASLTLTTSQGDNLTAPISGVPGQTSGSIDGVVEVDTRVIGRYTFAVYVTDRRGNRSNSLSGTFDVRINDTANRWTERALPLPSGSVVWLKDVVYGGSLYVAVGEDIFTSPDGVTWTERPAGVSEVLNDVTWSGGRFVAVGEGGTVATSADGVSWTLQAVPPAVEPVLRGVAGSGARYVAVGSQWDTSALEYRELILTSTDAVNWSKAAQSHSMDLHDVIWSGAKFVAVGTQLGGPNAEAAVLVSGDGLNWTKHLVGELSVLQEIAWNGAHFVATGYPGAVRSPDGISWTRVGQGTVGGGAIAWSGQRFLVCGTVYCQSSVDGVQWSSTVALLPGTGPQVSGLAWGDTKWVAVGRSVNASLVLTSP